MAINPYEERWQIRAKIGSGNGEFKKTDLQTNGARFLYHAIHILADGTARLARDGERIDGSFVSFDGDGTESNTLLIYSFRQQGMRFRNGGTTAISAGAQLVGAERAVSVGGEAQGTGASSQRYGYVKPYTIPASFADEDEIRTHLHDISLEKTPSGRVISPLGAAHATAADYPPADIIVSFGFE